MYTRYIKITLVFLLFFFGSVSGQNANNKPNSRYLSNLDFLYNEIKDYYVNLDLKEKKFGFNWNNLYEKYKKEMQKADSEQDLFRILSSFASELHDKNAMVYYKGRVSRVNLFKFSESLYLPFNARIIEDKVLIINSTTSPDISGNYILSINGVKIETILDKLENIYNLGWNENATRKLIVNRNRFIEYFSFFNDTYPDTLVYKLEDFYSGKITEYRIAENNHYRSPASSSRPHVYLGFHYTNIMPEYEILRGNTGYIRVPSFTANNAALIKGFTEAVDKMKESQVNSVIIDLRWSDGENESVRDLLTFFAQEHHSPYYFRFRDTFRFHDIFGGRYEYEDQRYTRNDKKNEDGYSDWWQYDVYPAMNKYLQKVPVVILTNQLTSEDAALFALAASQNSNVKIAGEEFTAGGHGLATPVLFPDRMYYIRYSFRETVDENFESVENKTVKPDIPVTQTVDDYKKGIDTQIETVLNYLNRKNK